MPSGSSLPVATDPAAIAALPPAIRSVYLDVFTGALHPVFLSAAVIAAFAFLLTWFLKERSEEHTSELQSLMRISYAVFCLKKKKTNKNKITQQTNIAHIQNTH